VSLELNLNEIWKFPIPSPATLSGEVSIEMPAFADILSIQVQGSTPCVWAICNPVNVKETRRFKIVPTGGPIGTDQTFLKYLSTIQLGVLVFHVFELAPGA
jgi:hypothetical protein